ncbi:hypothetical protein AC1031_003366 [Aphanomyces cochlioides]|nr:hypothetical protein AC1031_003366 [Aphanomyces cochlioides]
MGATIVPTRRGQRHDQGRLPSVLLFNVFLPLAIYAIATQYTSPLVAMVLYALPPLLKSVYEMAWKCRVDWISFVQLAFTGVSMALMVWMDDPRVGLVKEILPPLIASVMMLVSVVNERFNLLWLLYRFAATSSTKEELDAAWEDPAVRRHFQFLAGTVGTIIVTEDTLRLFLIFHWPFSTMVYLSPIVGASMGVLLSISIAWYTRTKIPALNSPPRPSETTPLV